MNGVWKLKSKVKSLILFETDCLTYVTIAE